ncbi:anaerobic ribonucleoside-triphosphate reductase activating protein [bacterium]|nr:anaerobic ribonucleoside-triphosphate reductase activating protein [bacterium]
MFRGIQKLTLIDFPKEVAATLFTGECNFRCPWCHNRDLAYLNTESFPIIPDDEMLDIISERRSFIGGVCITGGEPLMWGQRLKDFIKKIKALGLKVKIDTNGSFPKLLEEMIKEDLIDFVAMDIKNIPEKYAQTVGLASVTIEDINESIRLIKELPDHQFRTTMVPGLVDEADLPAMESWVDEKIIRQEYREIEQK